MREAFRRGVSRTLADRAYVILQRAADRGELSPTADLQLLSLLPHALLQQFRLTYEERPGPVLAARIVAQFFTPADPTRRPQETRPELSGPRPGRPDAGRVRPDSPGRRR
jgi:hypothetical protein